MRVKFSKPTVLIIITTNVNCFLLVLSISVQFVTIFFKLLMIIVMWKITVYTLETLCNLALLLVECYKVFLKQPFRKCNISNQLIELFLMLNRYFFQNLRILHRRIHCSKLMLQDAQSYSWIPVYSKRSYNLLLIRMETFILS